MRLSEEQVEKITALVLKSLKDKNLITVKADEKTVTDRMAEEFLKDLRAEEELNREVEKIMESHSDEIDTNRLDYRKMFSMIKNKLIKERELII